MQLILYRSRQSPKVCPQSKRAAMRDQELGSELFFKKKFQITSVYVHTRPEPTEDLAHPGVTGLLGTELLWRSNTGPELLRHPSSPRSALSEQAETASLEGRQLCCTPSLSLPT